MFVVAPGFLCHSHQNNRGVCEILVLGNPLLKSDGVSEDCPSLIYIFLIVSLCI